jgi:Flp pilus assembly protein TadB
LEEIIKHWNSELYALGKEFQHQAVKVAKWDQALLGNRDKIEKLANETTNLLKAQKVLDKYLDGIGTTQTELDRLLDDLEKEVSQVEDKMLQRNNTDTQRAQTFVVLFVCISFFGFLVFWFCFVLFCFVLFCFVLFCFVLFCFVLFCCCVTHHSLLQNAIGESDQQESK